MRRSKKPAEPPATDTERQLVSTRLLDEVFAGLEPVYRPTVLDLGPGDPNTVSYLSQFNARVFFLDLTDSPELFNAPDDISPADALALMEEHLYIPPDTLFDILLFWDYLHLLNQPMLEALATYLQPFIHPAARGYGFGTMRRTGNPSLNRYGIHSSDKLIPRPSLNADLPYHSHSQQKLAAHFLCMQISKATLLREGDLELLFTAY